LYVFLLVQVQFHGGKNHKFIDYYVHKYSALIKCFFRLLVKTRGNAKCKVHNANH